jgi:hypothetical protein
MTGDGWEAVVFAVLTVCAFAAVLAGWTLR